MPPLSQLRKFSSGITFTALYNTGIPFRAVPSSSLQASVLSLVARFSAPLTPITRKVSTKTPAMTSARSGQAGYFSTEIETPSPVRLHVTGTLPSYLNGSLYRNGPGVFETPHADAQVTPIRHWFDCVGMLHRFHIDGKNNTVTYNSRVSAQAVLRAAASVPKSKYVIGNSFGVQDPCKGIFGKLLAMFLPQGGPTKDPQNPQTQPVNVAVTIEYVPGQGVVSRSDFSTLAKFDAETLEVREFLNWSAIDAVEGSSQKELKGMMSAAHGQYDVATNEYYNFSFNHGADPGIYKILCVNAAGKTEVIASFREHCSYVHSMAMTENYVIFIVCPLRVNGIRVLIQKSFVGGMHYDTNAETKFYVVSRREKRVVAVYSSAPFWMFHTINAFEDASTGDVHVDLCQYEDADVVSQLYVENLRTKPSSFFSRAFATRYTLGGLQRAASESGGGGLSPSSSPSPAVSTSPSNQNPLRAVRLDLSAISIELPRFNEKYHMKPYRYVWGPGWGTRNDAATSSSMETGNRDGNIPLAGATETSNKKVEDSKTLFSNLVKVDVQNPEQSKTWMEQSGLNFSEAIFVADPDGSQEDDGVLVVVAYSGQEGRSALIIVDARTMTEVARAECSTRVPAGFHGSFVPKQAVRSSILGR